MTWLEGEMSSVSWLSDGTSHNMSARLTCKVSLGASEQLSVPLMPRHGRLIVAVDQRQVGQHPRHSVSCQVAVTVCKFVERHVDPVVT